MWGSEVFNISKSLHSVSIWPESGTLLVYFFSKSLKRLSLSLKKSNLKERKSLSLIAESLIRDEKQIVWKYTWNFQIYAMNNSSKGNPPSGNLISVSFHIRLEWKGRVLQALFVCWKTTRTKKKIHFFRLRSSCTYHKTAGCSYTRHFISVPFLCKTFSWWEKELPPHWKGLLCILSSDDSLELTESERQCLVLVPLSKAFFSQPLLLNQIKAWRFHSVLECSEE